MPEETAEERRARKARERQENAAKVAGELPSYIKPIPENWGYNEIAMEHTRLRTYIMSLQQLVITGKLDPKAEQDFEQQLVAQIHKIEERARDLQTGKHVPKPGE